MQIDQQLVPLPGKPVKYGHDSLTVMTVRLALHHDCETIQSLLLHRAQINFQLV